jgi:hypothetical protein
VMLCCSSDPGSLETAKSTAIPGLSDIAKVASPVWFLATSSNYTLILLLNTPFRDSWQLCCQHVHP